MIQSLQTWLNAQYGPGPVRALVGIVAILLLLFLAFYPYATICLGLISFSVVIFVRGTASKRTLSKNAAKVLKPKERLTFPYLRFF